MRVTSAVLVAAVGFGGARVAREAAGRTMKEIDEPYAPSATSAPFISLGYREAAADVLSIRLTGYFGGYHTTGEAVAALVEAIVALDPREHRTYEYGAMMMTYATEGVTQDIYLRALKVLERGAIEFPDDWKIPSLAGEIYTQDLQTTDPAQRRAWDEKGVLLTEAAIRKPGAPPIAATWAATMSTRLGQHDRAVRNLREMILITSDLDARKQMIEKLAKLEDADQAELAAELTEQQSLFEHARRRNRAGVRTTMYVLLGPRLVPGFDVAELATGGADLVGSAPIEKLEPLE